uniref:Uncharacterized protein n=1 Tax=Solanum tuberosum TaxID=4113 RepID=M1A569_SOLTU
MNKESLQNSCMFSSSQQTVNYQDLFEFCREANFNFTLRIATPFSICRGISLQNNSYNQGK